MTLTTGDIIRVRVPPRVEDNTVCACPSTYGYGFDLQLCPHEDLSYVVCNGDPVNGFCVMVKDKPEIPIGFVIMSIDGKGYYRITQVNHGPEPVDIEIIGKEEGEIPVRHTIGSQLFVV